jgi:ribonuclease HII
VPDRRIEKTLGALVCGVDEAGRGPLAGPVVAAAVILPARLPRGLSAGIDDSKKLARERREALFPGILECCAVGIGEASVAEIDRLNILAASHLAMRRAMRRLLALLPADPDEVMVDGHLDPGLGWRTRCIIGGDATVPEIGAASIIAKVARDRLLARLGRRHPAYGFERHAGYPTLAHRTALALVGVSPHHRRSFAPVRRALEAALAAQ